MIKRVLLIVLDSVGIGELPDAKEYGDEGSNTLGNIARLMKDFNLPNMQKIGLGNIEGMQEINPISNPTGSFGRCMEISKGKDTVTGHWEIAGVVLEKPLNTFPKGFPEDIINEFEKKIGRKVIGNKVASGTEIITEFGDKHMATGFPIVYTSADSVFQVAAHEEVIPLNQLYSICEIARSILVGDRVVGRVIARPFIGEKGNFTRTANRKDFALDPFKTTILEYIKNENFKVAAVGKIEDIYNGKGVTDAVHIKNNMDGVDKTLEFMQVIDEGLIFTNLVDFDMLYGHRNDVEGYGKALMEFDARIPEILNAMRDEDVLIITADHGCDPSTESTDHSREYIPVLLYGKEIKNGLNIGTRKSFADIGKSILDMLKIKNELYGESFANKVTNK